MARSPIDCGGFKIILFGADGRGGRCLSSNVRTIGVHGNFFTRGGHEKFRLLHTESSLLHTDLENFEGGSINSSVLLPNFRPFSRGVNKPKVTRGYPPDPPFIHLWYVRFTYERVSSISKRSLTSASLASIHSTPFIAKSKSSARRKRTFGKPWP